MTPTVSLLPDRLSQPSGARPAPLRSLASAWPSVPVSEARLVFGFCFLKAREVPAPALHSITKPGADLHSWIQALLAHCTVILPAAWHWGPEDCHLLFAHLTCLVAAAPCVPQRLPSAAGLHIVNAVA